MSYNSKRTGAQVEAALDKAENAVTGVKVNNTNKTPDANGLLDLGTIGGSSSATNKKVVLTSDEEMILKPNEVVVVFTLISNLTITGFENTPWDDNLDLEENGAAFYDEYTVIFNNTLGSDFTLTMPDSVLWMNGEMPQIDSGYYELSITRMAFQNPDVNVYKAVLAQFK